MSLKAPWRSACDESPGSDVDPQPTDHSGVGIDVDPGNLTAGVNEENVKVNSVYTDTSTDHIDRGLSSGTGGNGSSEESLTQKDIVSVVNVDETLETHNEWWHTAILLLTDIIGSGVLALPGAFARIGWFFGIVLLIVCYPM